jgi:hypothetical protein
MRILAKPAAGEASSSGQLAGQRPDKMPQGLFSHPTHLAGADALHISRCYPNPNGGHLGWSARLQQVRR